MRYRSERSLNIHGFFQKVVDLWVKCGYPEPIFRLKPLNEWEHYPCITYHVVRRDLAEGINERRPRERETFEDPNHPGEYVTLLGQYFDYVVQFTVWAKSNDEVDELLDRFEEFLLTYTGYFKQSGVNQLWFEQQLEDTVITSWRDPVVTRSIRYLVRMENIVPILSYELNRVLLDINIEGGNE